MHLPPKLLTPTTPQCRIYSEGTSELTKQGRYDRMTDDLFKLTGQKPLSMYDFVKLHAAEFTREGTAG